MRGAIALVLALASTQAAFAASTPRELADRYVAVQIALDPTLSDVSGLPGPKDRLPDLSAAAIDKATGQKAALLRQAAAIDPAGLSPQDRRTWAVLKEALEADLGLRVCRQELWSLNHFFGWQFAFPLAAAGQPVDTDADRAAALARWSSLPVYLDQDRANLEAGLALGYSVPKTVARRVVAQLDALLAVSPDQSPFASPGARSADPAFRAQMTALVRKRINPALRAYRDFLQTGYVPRARDGYGLSDLPNGAACYRASLRYFITLPTPPEEVAAMGARTVARNALEIGEIGARLFGERDVRTVVLKAKQAPANRLASPEAALAYSRERLAINEAAARKAIAGYPSQAVVIDPLPVSVTTAPPPHYEPEPDPAKPGRYVLPLSEWRTMTRGKTEWLAVHEAVPGHHVQMSSAFQRSSGESIDRVAVNAAFTEGWARYSETLAEELGLFETDFGRIERRAWPGHGQELDVGVHVGGWSTERAVAYLTSTGVDDEASAAAMLDRISVFPGQLTAYDTGAAEILALREEGRARLGARFDLARFHRAVLEQGAVPLTELRAHVRAWIAAEAKATRR